MRLTKVLQRPCNATNLPRLQLRGHMSDIRDAKVHKVDATSASVKRDNEGERVRAQPMCARSSAVCTAAAAAQQHWCGVDPKLTVHRVSPYVHVRSCDLCPTVLKRKPKMVHLPVLHGSGVVRQSHAALQEDRKKKTMGLEFLTRHWNHLLSLPSLHGSSTCNICRASQKGNTVDSSAA